MSRLTALIQEFSEKRILVLGDLMLDTFIWGKVSRISPEAPVPVVNVTSETRYPGGAANVARNIREFTPHTLVAGRVGDDLYGCQLRELLTDCGIDISGVQQDASSGTTVKTRIIARNQQVVRVDREARGALSGEAEERAYRYLEAVVPKVDAVIVADYAKGYLTQTLADRLAKIAREAGRILTVDPHPYTSIHWRGATAMKPNRLEAFLAAGLPATDAVAPPLEDKPLLEAGRRLMERWRPRDLLITLGEHGMLLLEEGTQPRHIPTCARTVFDVSGAGDTAIAALTLALAAGGNVLEAAQLANVASGIAVEKIGTATVTLDELLERAAAL